MTTANTAHTLTVAAPTQFPDFPPRTDMMNSTHLHDPGNQAALRLHLGSPDTTVVLSEVPIHWDIPAGRAGVRIPDLLVAFNIRRGQVIDSKGYSIQEQGKPPDFVLEIASDSTANNDIGDKRRAYANFDIGEYWLFDPDWGRRYPAGLMGWTLVDGRYEPIVIHQYAPGMYYGYSAALGLYLCWEHGVLRWYDPAAGYLRTHDEERNGRVAAEDQRDAAQEERDAVRNERNAARQERDAAQEERDRERESRLAAEARNQQLRAEIRRLRGEPQQ